ncbi:DedA family protein [Arthrobacter terrae]|uniref:DedA family protein n=1 Tax=Arthrobacter terrae TaxID=2935737 RepID=UPI0028AE64F5|nr:DedA family protein [Arthrobacter terrae]
MDLLNALPHLLGELNRLIEHSANQWWIVPLVMLFCLIDGFFLFLPSETAIVALAAISSKLGEPNIWLLLVGGAIGAILGDNIAYFLGRKLGVSRFRWMRRPRTARAFEWARKELDKRGAVLIFTARYIPVGRIAVNFTAGATRFPWKNFFWLDFAAALTWSGYSVGIGTFAGRWVHHNPLLGVGVAIVFAIIMGFIVDHAMKFFLRWVGRRAASKTPVAEHVAAGPDTAGQDTAGQDTAGQDTAGQGAAGPDAAGQGAAGQASVDQPTADRSTTAGGLPPSAERMPAGDGRADSARVEGVRVER